MVGKKAKAAQKGVNKVMKEVNRFDVLWDMRHSSAYLWTEQQCTCLL